MFAYIDPTVRQRLVDQNRLVRIDARGNLLGLEQTAPEGQHAINVLGPIPLPVDLKQGEVTLDWYATVRSTELSRLEELASDLREQGGQRLFSVLASSMAVNSVLVYGDRQHWTDPVVRVHSCCMTGDVFHSKRCECGPQFDSAIERIVEAPEGGMLIYMSGHEGRGIGLWAKAATYLLQDAGEDTYQANRSLGLAADCRDFADAASLIHYFYGDKPFRLLTNNPKKVEDLRQHGLQHISMQHHVHGVSKWNERYLGAKKAWGHQLSDEDLKPGND